MYDPIYNQLFTPFITGSLGLQCCNPLKLYITIRHRSNRQPTYKPTYLDACRRNDATVYPFWDIFGG